MVNTHTLGGQAGFWGFLGSKAEFRARAVRCVEGPAPVGLAGGGRWRVRPDGAGASPSGVFATHLAHSFGRGETTQGRCVAEAAGGANSPASADRSPKLDSWFPLKKRPPPRGSSCCGAMGLAASWERWDKGSIPSLAQWIEDPVLLQLRHNSKPQLRSRSLAQGSQKKETRSLPRAHSDLVLMHKRRQRLRKAGTHRGGPGNPRTLLSLLLAAGWGLQPWREPWSGLTAVPHRLFCVLRLAGKDH